MFQKKGQITLFIILGIIILVAFALIFYLLQSKAEGDNSEIQNIQSFELSTSHINSYVQSCIETVGEDALSWIGDHGGFFEAPTYNAGDYEGIAYYFYVDRNIMPSLEMVEKEISKYMDFELFFCLMNFVDFKKIGMKIEQGEIDTITMIRPNDVLFNVNFPVKISIEQKTMQLVSFQSSIKNARLYTSYDTSKSII